ncbi:riboflavin kinase, partial [Halobium palmae]
MAETASATTVGPDEVAALKHVALDGGLAGPVKVSCSGLASRLDASTQTASRRLQRLES